eukprot:1785239-Pleurochrysis_carterae.AAC.3
MPAAYCAHHTPIPALVPALFRALNSRALCPHAHVSPGRSADEGPSMSPSALTNLVKMSEVIDGSPPFGAAA